MYDANHEELKEINPRSPGWCCRECRSNLLPADLGISHPLCTGLVQTAVEVAMRDRAALLQYGTACQAWPLWWPHRKPKGRSIAALSSFACWPLLARLFGTGVCSPMAERLLALSTSRTRASLGGYSRLNIVAITQPFRWCYIMPKVPFFPRVRLFLPTCTARRRTVKSWGFLSALHGLVFPCVFNHRIPLRGILIPQWYELGFFDVYLRSTHVTAFEVSPDTAYVFVAATALQVTAGGLV